MKLVNDILYLEIVELTDCGISANTIWKASERKSNSWDFIKHPDDGRKTLVGYDKLRDDYKLKVNARYGNPYEYMAKGPIRKMVVRDLEAESFYLAYRYDGEKKLSDQRVRQYTWEASWLNMLLHADDNMKEVRRAIGVRMEDFYRHVGELLRIEKQQGKITEKFPTNYVNLKSRMRRYKEDKYPSLILDHYGNKRASKVNDEFSESLLLELIANGNQYDDVLIALEYNRIAIEKGYKPITDQTVGVWRRKMSYMVTAQRIGWAAFDDKYRRSIPGRRPSAPLYLVEHDDNHLDLLYIDLEDVTGSRFFHKYKAIVVIDSYNDYVLGYAYAQDLSKELVRAAYINAMYHIREITGAWHLPHEVRSDNWSIKALQPFYESIGHFHQSPTGSKKRGYIEQLFSTAHWKRCLKLGANNYTGNNITAQNRGVNQELLADNRKLYPTIQKDVVQQIETFFHRVRTMLEPEAQLSKQAQWLAAWDQLGAENKRPITDEQFLQKFGIYHNPQGRRIAITNKGITPEINGTRLIYDIPAELHLQNIGKSVTVVYDPFDMSRILVTDEAGLRFLATTAKLAPKAIKDMQPGDRTHLNALLAQKKDQSNRVAKESEKRKEVLFEKGIDAENLLQGGVLLKEIRQQAELVYQAGPIPESYEEEGFDPLDQM